MTSLLLVRLSKIAALEQGSHNIGLDYLGFV